MAGVREQRQTAGEKAADDLDRRDSDRERENCAECTARRAAVIVGVRVVPAVSVGLGSHERSIGAGIRVTVGLLLSLMTTSIRSID